RQLKIAQEFLGKNIKCPGCESVIRTRAATEVTPVAPPKPAVASKPAATAKPPAIAKPAADPQRRPARKPAIPAEDKWAAITPPPRQTTPRHTEDRSSGAGVKKKSACGTVALVVSAVGIVLLLACGGISFMVWTGIRNVANQFTNLQAKIDDEAAKRAPV